MDVLNDYREYNEYKIAVILWNTISPIYLIVGTIGNLLTVIVLMRRRSCNSSIAMYLTALAVSDLLVLWTGLLRQWILYMFQVDIRVLSSAGCKIHTYLVYVGFQCASWFLVAVTSERFISVWFPYKVKSVCRPRNALMVIAIIVLFCAALNHHWFYSVAVQTSYLYKSNQTDKLICGELNNHMYANFFVIWKWLDLCVVSLLPLTLQSIFNISIVCRVLTRKNDKSRRNPENTRSPISRKSKVSQLTIMLITVSVVFIICSTPMSVYIIGYPFWTYFVETNQEYAVLHLWWTVVNLLAYLNTSINFVLYFLSGSKFRQQVKEFFCRGQLHMSVTHGPVLRTL